MDILGVLPNGYHEVETVMQSIGLMDETEVLWEEIPGMGQVEIKITCNKPFVPLNEKNLAAKAVRLMEKVWVERFPDGARPEGRVSIDIQKSIPVAAGLAGGSGNAASCMIAMNELWNMGLTVEELLGLAAGLGADVPFTLLSQVSDTRCALGQGIGDKLTAVENRLGMDVLLVNPGFGVSTAEVYRGIDGIPDEERTRPDTAGLMEALAAGDEDRAYRAMGNGLEDYTLKAYPEVARIKEEMRDTEGLLLTMMSGSGPTVIGFYRNGDDAHKAAIGFRKAGYTVVTAEKV